MGRFIANPLDCPLTAAMNQIGGRWKPILLYILSGGPLRFGQLAAFVPAVSRKILTEQLREMEQDGLLQREVFAEVPPRVVYTLTEKGQALRSAMAALAEWSLEHVQPGRPEFIPANK